MHIIEYCSAYNQEGLMDEGWGRFPEAYDPEMQEKDDRELFPVQSRRGR